MGSRCGHWTVSLDRVLNDVIALFDEQIIIKCCFYRSLYCDISRADKHCEGTLMGHRLCQNCVKPEICKYSQRYIKAAVEIYKYSRRYISTAGDI